MLARLLLWLALNRPAPGRLVKAILPVGIGAALERLFSIAGEGVWAVGALPMKE
ncbi:MAG: hypothetical protein M3014_03300 [Chloroflexota bacterium]|nr:hypothetical protein [Chloroflexota bacterium]